MIYWSRPAIATPSYERQVVIGLISKCDGSLQNRKLAMGEIAGNGIKFYHSLILAYTDYVELDVCQDERTLVKVLDSILIDQRWFYRNGKLKVKAVITFMPEHMLKTTLSFLSYTNIKVFPLFAVSDLNAQWFDQFKIFYPVIDLIAETIVVKIIKRFGWKHSAIIDLVPSLKNHADNFKIENIQKELKSHCIDYASLLISDLSDQSEKRNELFKQLRDDHTVKVVVVKGHQAARFMIAAEKFGVNKYWVLLTQFRGDGDKDYPEFISITGELQKNFAYERMEFYNDTVCNPYYEAKPSNCSAEELSKPYHYKVRHFQYVKEVLLLKTFMTLSLALQNEKYNHLNINHLNINQYHNKTKHRINEIKDIKITTRAETLGQGECRECKHCKSQCEEVGLRYINYEPFNQSISRSCLKCKQNLIQSLNDPGMCLACPERKSANANQTMCYDPIIPEHIFFACYILDALGVFVCLLVALVYYQNRDTPVVRSSDFTLTAIQLSLCLLLFVCLPVLNSVQLSWFICTVRPCILGLLLAAIVSIVVCKAEKILIIFHTKQRLTQKDISEIHIRQIVIFSFLLAIDLIALSTGTRLPSEVRTRSMPLISADVYKQEYCSSDADFDIQIFYCMALLLLAIVQGYRGRKLPSNYNEGNSIVVGAASGICALSFTIWALNTKKHQYEQTSMVWLSLCVAILLLMVPLYGPKLYIIVFLPHKNTKQHLMKTVLSANSMVNSKPVQTERLSLVFNMKNRESLNRLLPKNSTRLNTSKSDQETAEAQV